MSVPHPARFTAKRYSARSLRPKRENSNHSYTECSDLSAEKSESQVIRRATDSGRLPASFLILCLALADKQYPGENILKRRPWAEPHRISGDVPNPSSGNILELHQSGGERFNPCFLASYVPCVFYYNTLSLFCQETMAVLESFQLCRCLSIKQ